jgi:hypothetical protein
MRASVYFSLVAAGMVMGCGASRPLDPGLAVDVGQRDVPDARAAVGYLDYPPSLVVPWCQALLVARDVVVTAAHCVRDIDVTALTFTVGKNAGDEAGRPAARRHRGVVAVITHDRAGDWRHDLAVLQLDGPISAAAPARLGHDAAPDGRLQALAYKFVPRGQLITRRPWAGEAQGNYDPITVFPTEGEPACHGDSGAAAIDAAGEVQGFVSGGGFEGPRTDRGGCLHTIKLASVADNQDFLEQALARLRPVVP